MIIKRYAQYNPNAAETYHQISPMSALMSIRRIAEEYGLGNLYNITTSEIDMRNGESPTGAPNDISLYSILQKDATALSALRDLYVCALEYRLPFFVLSVHDMMLCYEELGKNLAKKIFKGEYERDPSIISSSFGRALMANLYRKPTDDPFTVEECAFRRFLATTT